MAVVVKNTFFDVPEHKFLSFYENPLHSRRSHSLPRSWRPAAESSKSLECEILPLRKLSFSDCSTRSNSSSPSELSVFADVESMADISSDAGLDGPSIMTPTSSVGSPRGFLESLFSECSVCHAAEPEEICGEAEVIDEPVAYRTKLTTASSSFSPASGDSHMDAATSCVHLALVSCGQVKQVTIEHGRNGASSALISAELSNGSQAKAYDIMQLAKQSLEAFASQLDSVSLLSARVQKEEQGYSLRSSVACIPDQARDKMCWDILRCGHCPRRGTCRWYHPQEADIRRIKVSIKYTADTCKVFQQEQSKKHKISLGELL